MTKSKDENIPLSFSKSKVRIFNMRYLLNLNVIMFSYYQNLSNWFFHYFFIILKHIPSSLSTSITHFLNWLSVSAPSTDLTRWTFPLFSMYGSTSCFMKSRSNVSGTLRNATHLASNVSLKLILSSDFRVSMLRHC